MLIGEEPLVSIITLNYNQATVTCEFLESTRALTYSNYEILVCDMVSQHNPSGNILSGNYPKTRVLISPENLGFSAGNNWGIRQAHGSFVFVVNSDTEVTPDLIQQLLKPFYSDSSIAVTSPKIKFYSDPDIIQYAGFGPMNAYTGRSTTIGEMEKDRGQYGQSGPTCAAHGCAMMIKKAILVETGMFPEVFFLYYEEWDLSARILKAGHTIWYTANAVIYHKESVSVGKLNPMKTYYLTRNRILFMRRNYGLIHLTIFTLFFTFFTIPKSVVQYALRKQFLHLKQFFKAVLWNIGHSNKSVVA